MTKFEKNLINESAKFYINLAENGCTLVNGHLTFTEEYNLVVSRRDFNLYSNGIKPYRSWSFNAAKKYYGLTGNAQVANEKMKELYEDFKEWKEVNLIRTEK